MPMLSGRSAWLGGTQVVGLEISPGAAAISKLRFGADCYSGVRFAADGGEDVKGPTNGWNDSQRGQWLNSGDSSDVWVERTVNSGAFDDEDEGAGRHNLGTDRAFSIVKTNNGIETTNVTFDFWDAASGGSLLDTVTYDVVAEWTT